MTYKLKQCVWELTTACNLRCGHCGSNAGLARENELTLDECLRVCNELSDLECKNVSLIGGEVFLRKDWHIIARDLVEKGIETSIITNGYDVGISELTHIKESGIEHICISVDGTEKTHDMLRGQGSFSLCIELIRKLKQKDYLVSGITTISMANIDDMEQLSRVLFDCEIDAWQIQLCAPFGRACDKASRIPTKSQLVKLLDFIVQKRETEKRFIVAADNIGYFSHHEHHIRSPLGLKGCYGGCSAGIRTVGIDSVGNIRGCEALYDECFIEGNVRNTPLSNIWNSEETFRYNRRFDESMLTGACASCNVRNICTGGCRSINYFSHGNLYESLHCVR